MTCQPLSESLTFEKLKVLAVVPGVSWKKEDVEREYLELGKQIGAPAYLLCDGAVELREPAEKLEFDGQKDDRLRRSEASCSKCIWKKKSVELNAFKRSLVKLA